MSCKCLLYYTVVCDGSALEFSSMRCELIQSFDISSDDVDTMM